MFHTYGCVSSRYFEANCTRIVFISGTNTSSVSWCLVHNIIDWYHWEILQRTSHCTYNLWKRTVSIYSMQMLVQLLRSQSGRFSWSTDRQSARTSMSRSVTKFQVGIIWNAACNVFEPFASGNRNFGSIWSATHEALELPWAQDNFWEQIGSIVHVPCTFWCADCPRSAFHCARQRWLWKADRGQSAHRNIPATLPYTQLYFLHQDRIFT